MGKESGTGTRSTEHERSQFLSNRTVSDGTVVRQSKVGSKEHSSLCDGRTGAVVNAHSNQGDVKASVAIVVTLLIFELLLLLMTAWKISGLFLIPIGNRL
jgi:hypothetical protein